MTNLKSAVSLALIGLVLLAVEIQGARRVVRTTNVNKAYQKWYNKTVPFYIDPDFNPTEAATIRQAINAITAGLPPSCVNFMEVPSSNTAYKIKFSALTGGPGSQGQTYCYAYPGMIVPDCPTSVPGCKGPTTNTEQLVSLARGPSGCWDGTLHSLMKFVAISLGKRNEHQRQDRNNSITINTNNIAAGMASAYNLYNLNASNLDAYYGSYAYDLCSITHAQPNDYANPGTAAFTVNAGVMPSMVPKMDMLSLTDCKVLSMLYGCPVASCTQPPCGSMTTGSPPTGSPPTGSPPTGSPPTGSPPTGPPTMAGTGSTPPAMTGSTPMMTTSC
ncbi:hypothetical protein BV898_08321 [Hypsibius exemplaris]|uniref:Peptidase M12A domain-containing protein n=1 Tax=Hypsibius exemplaris TaxID=2072580 RepID=A0A1W0WQR8_HYPEX|nr:hypothetical protein BV898_08321 [Hypsibius exemplaris]